MTNESKTACFAVFSTESGKKALAYLKERVAAVQYPRQTTTEELWFREGERAVVAEIELLTKRSLKND